MKPRAALTLIFAMVVSILGTPGIGAVGTGGAGPADETGGPKLSLLFANVIFVRLSGYEEVMAVSTPGRGVFQAQINSDQITYSLSYAELQGTVQQAHIHFGQFSVNGGIVAFLCTNLGNGPAGTQPCPPSPATITGTIHPADIVGGAAAQGIAAGQFDEVVAAIRNGIAYANVHSSIWPGGEIRAQLPGSPHDFFKHD
jgi:CHRD domain